MKELNQTTGVVTALERCNNTVAGNPVYKIVIAPDSTGVPELFRTKANSSWVYGIDFFSLQSKRVKFKYHKTSKRKTNIIDDLDVIASIAQGDRS